MSNWMSIVVALRGPQTRWTVMGRHHLGPDSRLRRACARSGGGVRALDNRGITVILGLTVRKGSLVQQEVVLALLAKEPSHGYELRARLRQALGPLGEAMNDGQVYVTLTRLEKAGFVECEQAAGLPDRPDRKVYALTAAGQQRVAAWLADVSWPRPDLAEFHLKLIAAAAAGLADPV